MAWGKSSDILAHQPKSFDWRVQDAKPHRLKQVPEDVLALAPPSESRGRIRTGLNDPQKMVRACRVHPGNGHASQLNPLARAELFFDRCE
jgi:hypothetical protein